MFLAALHNGFGRRRRGNWLHGGPVKVKMNCPSDGSVMKGLTSVNTRKKGCDPTPDGGLSDSVQ